MQFVGASLLRGALQVGNRKPVIEGQGVAVMAEELSEPRMMKTWSQQTPREL